MSIDHTGTAPGLKEAAEEEVPKLHMRCKNSNCDSILAIEIKAGAMVGHHLYQCVRCRMTWGVATGGAIEL